jgi:hypothetical protein
MVMGRQSQKYAEVNRKWSLPKTFVTIHPGEIIEKIACIKLNML